VPTLTSAPNRYAVIPALGITQILAWGSSYYLLAVLAVPIADDTGWSLSWIVGGLSIGLLMSGAVSPRVGRLIERRGGRTALILSAVFLSLGLAITGIAPNLIVYIFAWVLIGLGMGFGLYDPAFSTLARLYGTEARSAITALTLFGGFASTVCWPLSAYLTAQFGWREACLIYAAIHAGITLPIYILALPNDDDDAAQRPSALTPKDHRPTSKPDSLMFAFLALVFAVGSLISAALSVHLLTILQGHGLSLAVAVGLGTLVGPSQVGARFIEMLIGHRHHSVWTKIASTLLVAAGLGMLWSDVSIASVALIAYGAGIGLDSIARGTVPLSIYGAQRYPSVMGKLAVGNLLAQAIMPVAGAYLIGALGAQTTLGFLAAAATLNVAATGVVYALIKRAPIKSA